MQIFFGAESNPGLLIGRFTLLRAQILSRFTQDINNDPWRRHKSCFFEENDSKKSIEKNAQRKQVEHMTLEVLN